MRERKPKEREANGVEYGKVEEESKGLRAADILSRELWKDQQRGCFEHCANHQLYARHMVPFFAEIPTGKFDCIPVLFRCRGRKEFCMQLPTLMANERQTGKVKQLPKLPQSQKSQKS